MQHVRKLFASAAVIASLTGVASATTRSSFQDSSWTGISVVHQSGLSYLVTLDVGAKLTYQGNDYAITDLIGFYALSNSADFSPFYSLSDMGDFKDDSSNSGPGGTQGWRSNPNKGLTPGQSKTFTFNNLDTAHNDQWGFHFRVAGTLPNGGNTGSFTTTVPAPASAASLALAGLVGLRRRR